MILEMKHIVKLYGSLLANDDVSISLDKGEILAIVGENGAGKSTLMKVLYGLERPSGGEIWVKGRKTRFSSPSDAMAAGIGMVQQHFMLFDSMTVAENITFKKELKKGLFLDRKKMDETVRALSEKYMLAIDPDATIEECPVGLRQRVEILKILYQNAEVIIFDEPSAVLTPLEVDGLLETIRSLAAMGKSIILITHKLQEVMAVADRIYVMRQGRVVAERKKSETDVDELSFLMVGTELAEHKVAPKAPGETLLRTEGLRLADGRRKLLDGVSIHVDAGEIVGVAGVSGNGQTELVQCITGLRAPMEGSVVICGKDVTGRSPRDVREAGLSHISEDRFEWGSAPEGTLAENVLMGKERRERFSRRGFIDSGEVSAYCSELIKSFGVKASSPSQKLRELSGGNAQKLIVAREMELDAPLLVSCEPTRGLDVGATDFIHEQLIRKRDSGGGVLLVSSELTEIMGLSDRIYVMFEGRVNGEFKRDSMDDKSLGLLMVGRRRDDEKAE